MKTDMDTSKSYFGRSLLIILLNRFWLESDESYVLKTVFSTSILLQLFHFGHLESQEMISLFRLDDLRGGT